MEIKINNTFTLGVDTFNFIVSKYNITKKGDNKGQYYIARRAYFPSPEQAFNYILEQDVAESDATTLKELVTTMDKIKNELNQAIEDNILTIVDFKDQKESYGYELQKIIKLEREIKILKKKQEKV